MKEQAIQTINELGIKYTLNELLEFKKVYTYFNKDKKTFRIHANKYVDGKQLKVQIYNLKKTNMKDSDFLEFIYTSSLKFVSIVEELKLQKRIDKERQLRDTFVYDNEMLSFLN